jgi:hypothetical protein
MNADPSPVLSYIEWETLPSTVILTDHGPLSTAFTELRVTRDAEYNLDSELAGHISNGLLNDPPPAGTVTSGGESRGHTPDGRAVTLTGVVQGSPRTIGTGDIRAAAEIGSIKLDDSTTAAAWVSVWCLNGSSAINYPRGTQRVREGQIRRIRLRSDETTGAELAMPGGFASYSSSDYFELKNIYYHLRFCLAPDEIGPSWCHKASIEILAGPYDTVPAQAPKDLVNALGFFLGRRIIPIGCTWFGTDGMPTGTDSFRPWTWDVKRTCEHPDAPPVTLCSPFLNEALLSDLIVRFLGAYDELQLSHAFWNYWLAIMSPPDAAIGHFSTVLETLMNAWFRSKRSKSSGLYMSARDFEAATSGGFSTIEAALVDNPDKDKILSRLKGANRFGANEKFGIFLNELGLPIADVEKHVIRSRNRIVHGNSGATDGHSLVHNMRAYRAFANRVILKLLGHAGNYIDYSSSGFPERHIDAPLGGPQGDQRPS